MQDEQTTKQMKIQKLDDEQLVKYLDKLLSYERKLNQTIILALGEIQERRLYTYLGYASLFEMLVKHFKLSETAAYQRLNTMKLIKAVPEVHKMIESGNLSLTNAAMAQTVIQKIEKSDDKRLSALEKQEIVQSVCNKTQKQAQIALTEIHPMACLPKTIEKPITAELTQVQVILNKETSENLQTLKSLYSHKVPDGDLNKLFELVISNAVKNHQFNKIVHNKRNELHIQKTESEARMSPEKSLQSEKLVTLSAFDSDAHLTQQKNSHVHDSKQPTCTNRSQRNITKVNKKAKYPDSSSTKRNQTRYVKISVKRKIYQRAKGQCEFQNQHGHRCQSHYQLEFDHIHSISHGGNSQQENIQLLCRFHNQMKVKKTHGFLYCEQSNFT